MLLVVCEHYDAAGVLEAKPVLQAILDALQRERRIRECRRRVQEAPVVHIGSNQTPD